MDRYGKMFGKLRGKNEGAFIPFVVLGDPDFNASKKIVGALSESADALELGFPFSDPIADGKRIQVADQRALEAGINSDKCFEIIRGIRARNSEIPIGLLLYYNLVYSNGVKGFLVKAKEAGVDGILIADMPIEESHEVLKEAGKIGLKMIFTVAPTTNDRRIREISAKASGFMYVVGLLGVTGERKDIKDSALELVKRVKKNSKLPACIGFGISMPEHVKKIISAGADGAIVGSAIEAVIERNLGNEGAMISELKDFCAKLKAATVRK